ncbi:E3 ubiquitin-protein ligase TRIM58-like [Lissotriton helveticus]
MGCGNAKPQGPDVKSYKATVTLDPDTTHPQLILCVGRRRAQGTETWQCLPDTPKRFTYWPCVVGSEGFTSGKHYWEVQLVQEGIEWDVGIAAESVRRKEDFKWSPEGGVWVVQGRKGQYSALTSKPTILSPSEKPRKLGVYLDYEGKQLSLYNADSMELLHTFPKAPFKGSLFPIFLLAGGADLVLV